MAVDEEMRRVPEAAAGRRGSFSGSADRGSSLETGADAFLNSYSFSASVPDVRKMFSRPTWDTRAVADMSSEEMAVYLERRCGSPLA